MALRKEAAAGTTTAEPTKVAQPAFEVEGDNAPATPEVKVAATTALAATGSRAMTATGKKFSAILSDLENALPPEQAEVLKRIKSGAGCIRDSDGYSYGRHIEVTLVSFHTQWVVSPGSDTDEAKEHVRYSYDGKTTTDGDDVAAYLEKLRTAEGYDNAAVKTYTILVGVLESSEKGGGFEGDLVQVSLSPQSKDSFENYRLQTGVKAARGKVNLDEVDVANFRIEAESKSRNNRDFTLLTVVGKV